MMSMIVVRYAMKYLKVLPPLLNRMKVSVSVLILLSAILLFNLTLHAEYLKPSEIQYLVMQGDRYLEKLDYENAHKHYQKAFESLKLGGSPETIASVRNKLITSLWKVEEVEEASGHAFENLQYCLDQFGWDHPETARTLENLGVLSFLTGENTIVFDYFTKALQINRKYYGKIHPSIAFDLQWIGSMYENWADSVRSHKYLFESLDIWKAIHKSDHPDMAEVYRLIGLHHKRFYGYDSCLFYFNRALGLYNQKYGTENVFSLKCIVNICDHYETNNRMDTAFILLNRAVKILDRIRYYKRNAATMIYYNYAIYYTRREIFDKAIEKCQKIFEAYFPYLKGREVLENPDPDNLKIFPHILWIIYLKIDLLNLELKYRQPGNKEILMSQQDLNRLSDIVQDKIRLSELSLDNMLEYESLNQEMNSRMAYSTLMLYHETHDTAVASEAIYYLNKNRISIDYAIDVSDRKPESFFPPHLVAKWKEISNSLNRLKNLSAKSTTQFEADRISAKITENNILLSLANDKLRRSNSLYFKIFHDQNRFYLGDVQNKLNPDQLLIMLVEVPRTLLHSRRLYQAIISMDKIIEFRMIDMDSLFIDLDNYRFGITALKPLNSLDSTGYRIYRRLFMPYEKEIQNKELVLMPTLPVSLIPFDGLPTNNHRNSYLIFNHKIRYIHTLQSFLAGQKHVARKKNPKVLGIVPSFKSGMKKEISQLINCDTCLVELPHALNECMRISEIVDIEIQSGFTATESFFVSNHNHYSILHLSTHGVPDNNTICPIKLAFSRNDSHNDGFLNIFELLNLRMSNEMVVLSACKTGYGNLDYPVVNLNLGWVFMKAGSESVVVSLWDANDYSSSIIMPEFYKNLKAGMTRPEALRQAKIAYLKQADGLMHHPLYWAGFQYYGPNEPVSSLITNPLNFSGPLFVLLILGLGLFGVKTLLQRKFQLKN